jgi:hypothetical protein
MKILSLKLPESLDAELEAAAARRGTTKSALLRDALVTYLGQGAPTAGGDEVREPPPPPYGREAHEPDKEAEDDEPARPSFLSLAGDFAGCVEGAADLSSNPEHLRGFGR